jgi:hypothetical protein
MLDFPVAAIPWVVRRALEVSPGFNAAVCIS